MKSNLGTFDRIARLVIAVVVAVLYLTGVITGTLAIVLIAVAAVLALTAMVSFCPLYRIFGISSGPKPNKNQAS